MTCLTWPRVVSFLGCATSVFAIASCGANGESLFAGAHPLDGGSGGTVDSDVVLREGGSGGTSGSATDCVGGAAAQTLGGTAWRGAADEATPGPATWTDGTDEDGTEDGSAGAGGAEQSAGAGGDSGDTAGAGGTDGGASGGAGGAGGVLAVGGEDSLGPVESACDDVSARCRPFNLGLGAPYECDELGRGRNEVECQARRPECAAACSSGEVLPFQIEFAARVGELAYDCRATYAGVGADDATIHPVDFRFYVHDVRLLTDTGEEVPASLEQDGFWQMAGVALLDFENKAGRCVGNTETNTRVVGTVPWGVYRGMAFKLGVPVELNHSDVASQPAPLNVNALFVSRRTGYEFLSLANAAELGSDQTFESVLRVHSVGCVDDPNGGVTCSKPNRAEYRFERFWRESSRVVVDVKEVLAKSELKSERCQSSEATACAWPFDILGINWVTGRAESSIQRFIQIE